MLIQSTQTIAGITFIAGAYNVRPFCIRPTASKLVKRYNEVYAEATRTETEADLGQRLVKAHAAAEDYTVRVCEAVLGDRLTAYVTPDPVETLNEVLDQPDEEPVVTFRATKSPAKPRKAATKAVKHSTECADICVCGSQR